MDQNLLWIGVSLLAGLAVGAWAHAQVAQRQQRAKRHIPRKSAMIKRPLVTSRERFVWRWLQKVFADYHIMIKIPVTRFTLPVADVDRDQWFALLSDVYCTFTIVSNDGKVLGCVDVAGSAGLPQANLQVKRSVFGRCGVVHWVVQAEQLPREADIISAFMQGNPAIEAGVPDTPVAPSELDRAKSELQATVTRQRSSKSQLGQTTGTEDSVFIDSMVGTDWAPDSFNGPLDSRAGDLHKP